MDAHRTARSAAPAPVRELDEPLLAQLLLTAVRDTDPAEVMPPVPGPPGLDAAAPGGVPALPPGALAVGSAGGVHLRGAGGGLGGGSGTAGAARERGGHGDGRVWLGRSFRGRGLGAEVLAALLAAARARGPGACWPPPRAATGVRADCWTRSARCGSGRKGKRSPPGCPRPPLTPVRHSRRRSALARHGDGPAGAHVRSAGALGRPARLRAGPAPGRSGRAGRAAAPGWGARTATVRGRPVPRTRGRRRRR